MNWWTRVWQAPSAPVAVAALAVLVLGACAWPFTVDDAFIVLRYGERIVGGQGYTMVAGPPTDGVTGPLWLVPVLVARLAGLPTEPVMKALGVVCMAVSIGLVVHRLRARVHGRVAAWLAVVLLSCQSSFGIWGVAGLETGAATLAVTVAWLGATRRPSPRGWTTAVACAVLPWLRPECVVLALVLVIVVALRNRREGVRTGLFAALSIGSLIAFRLAMFGDPLPLSFYAKPGELIEGLRYVGRGLFLTTGFVGIVFGVMAVHRGRSRADAAVVAAHLVAVGLAGGDWMPGARLLVPVLPILLAVALTGIGRVRRKWVAVVCFALVAVIPAVDIFAQVPVVREAGTLRATTGRELADWLKSHGKRVALVDVGYLGFHSGLDVVDLGGVTDPVVARRPGGHLDKDIDPGWLVTQDPDLIVLHSSRPPVVGPDGSLEAFAGYPVELCVATDPWVRAHFRVARVLRYHSDYWYVVLARRERA